MDVPGLYQVRPENIDMDGAELRLLNLLLDTWGRHIANNVRNEAYYYGRVRPVSTDTNDPEELRRLGVVMGWGGKCVDVLAARSVLDGWAGDGAAASELEAALGIDMPGLYQQAVVSELTDSCSFLTVSKGAAGEPDVIVSAHSALDAVAVWDERRKRIRAGLCVIDIEEMPDGTREPTWLNMYTDDMTYSMRRAPGGRWGVERVTNPLGRPLMEPLRYRPTLTRPFGRSRINRTVRSLIDRALCVGSRTEVTATYYTWPMRYLLGVDKKTVEGMGKRKLELYSDRMLIASTTSTGSTPQLGQLPQATMQPHIDHLEMLAKQFASEASVPLDEVGIVFDNPSSAEAMEAAQKRLITEAEDVNRLNGIALRNVARMALACMRGVTLDGLDEAALSVRPMFANPLRPSASARADFALKVASMVPEYAMTPHCWRDLGYSVEESAEILRDVNAARAANMVAQQAAARAASAPAPAPDRGE